jgi:heme exporter protein C
MPLETPLFLLLVPVGTLLALPFKRDLLKTMWRPLLGLALVMLAAEAYIGLVWTPPETFMGDVYRILYVHVPQVWMALLAMTLNFGASLYYLVRKSFTADALAEAAAEVSLYFGFVGVTLGAIWGRPTWGVYWTWDPRLTSAAVMLIYLAAYLVLRRFIDNPDTRGTFSAAVGVFGIVIPITVYFSVKWMVSIHQVQSSPKTVDPSMVMSLRWSACAFLCLMIVFIYQRFLIAKAALAKEVAVPDALPAAAPSPNGSKGAVA